MKEVPYSWVKQWLLQRHYARRNTSHVHCFGLFLNDSICGVATFGLPPSPTLVVGVCGSEHKDKVLEFNRLCVDEGLGTNILSFFTAKCLKMIDGPKIIVSYADTDQGHIGYIYQATNWVYTGLCKTPPMIEIGGVRKNFRSVIGADRLATNINGLKEKFDNVTVCETAGKHRYIYFIGTKKQKKELRAALKYSVLPYPKGESSRYNSGEGWEKRGFIYKR